MAGSVPPRGFSRLSPPVARGVLAAVLLLALASAAVTLSPISSGRLGKENGSAGSDTVLYKAEVERIRAGAGYYQAAAEELTARGYPTRSVFNWRTPLPVWMIAKLPGEHTGKWILGLMSLALMLAAFEAMAREQGHGLGRPIACALLLSGPLAAAVWHDQFLMPMSWAGVLIALSLVLYGLERPFWAVAFGLAAVFFRELALPYCLLAAAIALCGRQWRELAAWLLGLAAWAVFFGVHWFRVHGLVDPNAVAHDTSWIQFGGLPFVIGASQMNLYLMFLPQWMAGLYLTAALLGLAGWNTPFGRRVGLTVCLFVTAFSLVGQEFNQYWGLLITPVLCFGVARAPGSIVDLWRAAAWRTEHGRCAHH